MRHFQEAFDVCQTQHTVLLDLARAYTYQRAFPLAIQAAQQFTELEPGSAAGRLALANAYFVAQRLPDALREAEQVLKTRSRAARRAEAQRQYRISLGPAR